MVRRIQNVTSFEPQRVIEPIYTGGDVSLSEDGRLLATCLGEDVLLTDFATGQRLAKVDGDAETVTSLCLTPSGSHIAICSRSLSLRLYSLDRSADAVTVSLTRTIKSQSLPIVKTATDRTGTLLATGSSDGTVRVWDIKEGHATHTLHGHGSVISSLHFFRISTKQKSKETVGYRLAAGSEDGKLRIWNLETRKSVAFLDTHVSVVSCLDFDPDSGTLLSASRDRTVMLWDTSSWQTKVTIPVLELVESAGFLSSSLLYTSGEAGQVRLWKASGQSMTPQEKGTATGIVQTIHHPGLPFLVAVHADQVLRVHSKADIGSLSKQSATLPVVRQVSGTHDEVIDLAYVGADRCMLAIATNIEEIRLLSLRGTENKDQSSPGETADVQYFGADVGSLAGHEDIVICLDVDWSGYWLVSGAKDNTAKLWRLDPSTNAFECFATFTGHAESVGAVALPKKRPPEGTSEFESPWSHVPSMIITGSQDKTVKRWDISSNPNDGSKTTRASFTRKAHDRDINAVDINHNSTLFASASQDRTVKIWSTEEGETVGVLRGHRRGVWSIRFSAKGVPPISAEGSQASGARGLALTGSGDRTVKIWSLSDYSCLRTFEGHTNSVLKTVWMNLAPPAKDVDGDTEMDGDAPSDAKRGAQVASAGADGLVKVWDVGSAELATTLDNHTDRVWALAVHPATNEIISGGGDGVMTFWKDTTSIKMAAAAAESTARVEQDQELQNFIRAGSYRQAIELALQLNHPARLLGLFTAVTSRHPPEEGSICGVRAVDEVLGQLSDERLLGLLSRLRDWNANAKTAPVAQRVLLALLRIHSPARLMKIRGSKGAGIKELLEGLRVYTERQLARMEELIDESYLVEYTLQEMESVGMA